MEEHVSKSGFGEECICFGSVCSLDEDYAEERCFIQKP